METHPRHTHARLTIVGLLVISAFSLATAWGRKPPREEEVKVALRALPPDDTLASKYGLNEVIATPLKRAFPAVRFYRGFDNTTLPPPPYMIAVVKDKRYAMPAEFNRLLLDNGLKVTDKNVAELAEAFATTDIGGWFSRCQKSLS
jgi:hypothetical protein